MKKYINKILHVTTRPNLIGTIEVFLFSLFLLSLCFSSCQKKMNNFDLKAWGQENNLTYFKSKAFTAKKTEENTKQLAFVPTIDGKHILDNKFFVLTECPVNIPKNQEIEVAYNSLYFFFKIGQKLYVVSADENDQLYHKLGDDKCTIFRTGLGISTCSEDFTLSQLPHKPDGTLSDDWF
jgi:hypothetical protein